MANEGLLKTGDRALFVNNEEEAIFNYRIFSKINIDSVSYSDLQRQVLMPDKTYEFVMLRDFHATTAEFIDRVLKSSGVAIVQLSDDPSAAFPKPSGYRIVYLRRFYSTFIAMRKTESNQATNGRRLLTVRASSPDVLESVAEAKKAALKKLEDALLEPPRSASGKSKTYLKRTKYLPDLMGVSLRSYPRRVFIDVGLPEKSDTASDWFSKHYPTRNEDFEIYKIVIGTTGVGMSDWLRKNVREDEYVVMKAEAEVVEEMVRSKSIRLVDELFMECKHQGIKEEGKRSRRAYWECLALYGVLRDEGVAVHQWWG
ncbi:hypothetical protein LguiB_019799 [Lonicera macranthoides]